MASGTVGRFAPSPTGSLHLGSLVAAIGSWLFARSQGGRWFVRMEDLDTARVVPGSADDILRSLERYGLTWDGEVAFQSQRTGKYEEALRVLRVKELVYACACSRADIMRAASAPAPGEDGDSSNGGTEPSAPPASRDSIYPGTCREGLPAGRRARAFRFRVPSGLFTFKDLLLGSVSEDVAVAVGDFAVKRADGPFAYQLAVVVDDAEQGVTQVVRGADLLSSTARQIALQRALGVPSPTYAHLPLVLGPDGSKLGKRDGALPLATLDEARIRETLAVALGILGQPAAGGTPREMLEEAVRRFDPRAISREPWRMPARGAVRP